MLKYFICSLLHSLVYWAMTWTNMIDQNHLYHFKKIELVEDWFRISTTLKWMVHDITDGKKGGKNKRKHRQSYINGRTQILTNINHQPDVETKSWSISVFGNCSADDSKALEIAEFDNIARLSTQSFPWTNCWKTLEWKACCNI